MWPSDIRVSMLDSRDYTTTCSTPLHTRRFEMSSLSQHVILAFSELPYQKLVTAAVKQTPKKIILPFRITTHQERQVSHKMKASPSTHTTRKAQPWKWHITPRASPKTATRPTFPEEFAYSSSIAGLQLFGRILIAPRSHRDMFFSRRQQQVGYTRLVTWRASAFPLHNHTCFPSTGKGKRCARKVAKRTNGPRYSRAPDEPTPRLHLGQADFSTPRRLDSKSPHALSWVQSPGHRLYSNKTHQKSVRWFIVSDCRPPCSGVNRCEEAEQVRCQQGMISQQRQNK